MEKFNILLGEVYKKSPLQKKKIEAMLLKSDDKYLKEAGLFAEIYLPFLKAYGIDVSSAAADYVKFCSNMMSCQVYFMKTGKYPLEKASEPYKNIYSDEKEMQSYMIGQAISMFLWSTHYNEFLLFLKYIEKYAKTLSSYLEIGPGHGLFLNRALDFLNKDARVTAVDISPVSMRISKNIINYLKPHSKNINFIEIDMLDLNLNEKYDFITMGEVLEHVNYPEKLLLKLRELLSEKGMAYISSCANGPAIDHVYHFKYIEEIRKMLEDSGLKIIEDKVLPTEDMPMAEILEKKIAVDYCAIVGKK